MDTVQLVSQLLKKTNLAVISTVGEKAPGSSVLEFGQTENLELIFDTFTSARKYKNLKNNVHVSFVIGWDENITVQYEGIAQEIKEENLDTYKQIYFAKIPEAKKWEKTEGITYFKVIPRWIRYSDLNKNPWYIQELTF